MGGGGGIKVVVRTLVPSQVWRKKGIQDSRGQNRNREVGLSTIGTVVKYLLPFDSKIDYIKVEIMEVKVNTFYMYRR